MFPECKTVLIKLLPSLNIFLILQALQSAEQTEYPGT